MDKVKEFLVLLVPFSIILLIVMQIVYGFYLAVKQHQLCKKYGFDVKQVKKINNIGMLDTRSINSLYKEWAEDLARFNYDFALEWEALREKIRIHVVINVLAIFLVIVIITLLQNFKII